VHLSGGVGIGGVLEPLQANPTIIEDNCFIGARSEVVEGVIVEENSVISMGVYIGQSTPIYDRATGEISYGRVPAGLGGGQRQPAQARRRQALQPVLRHHRQAVDAQTAPRPASTTCCAMTRDKPAHRATT
jgi:2,3,4,5-tetrahydropyridine-2,6-dicarboxylate N-succinyltransferase